MKSTAHMRAKQRVRDFNIPGALEIADRIMALPCAGIVLRVAGHGQLVMRFVLPLALCKTTNQLIGMARSASIPRPGKRPFNPIMQAAKFHDDVFAMMALQHPRPRAAALTGRPQVLCVRFSSTAPDRLADGMKTAVDFLRPPVPPTWSIKKNKLVGGRKGFNFVVDDSPTYIDGPYSWWEKAPPASGFGLLEIWSGA